jgi:hypothetical protein
LLLIAARLSLALHHVSLLVGKFTEERLLALLLTACGRGSPRHDDRNLFSEDKILTVFFHGVAASEVR